VRGWLKAAARRVLPARLWQALRVLSGRGAAPYEILYEAHARQHGDGAVGAGPFELIGKIELSLLLMEGLTPTSTLVDLGCGSGRLAVHAIPLLAAGHYIGIDIAPSLLERARERVDRQVGPRGVVSWIHQEGLDFALESHSVDMMCAFSVFTHMEHEDTYRYLCQARRILRPHGRFILSCLPLELDAAREIFVTSANVDLARRWATVRNVTTSRDLMESVARLAGWTPVRWYSGNDRTIPLFDTGERRTLGQSVLVLEPASAPLRPQG